MSCQNISENFAAAAAVRDMSHLEESAFGLTANDLEQIEYLEVLKRRRKLVNSSMGGPKSCFSHKLSVEAQIAMQLALEDTVCIAQSMSPPHVTSDSGYGKSDTLSIKTSSTDSRKSAHSNRNNNNNTALGLPSHKQVQNSYSELYRRNSSARMRKDITDEEFSEEKETKRALGGGKVESAMEIIEIIQHGDDGIMMDCTAVDDEAISELARINSVEKCEVWMQATEEHRVDPECDLDLNSGQVRQ